MSDQREEVGLDKPFGHRFLLLGLDCCKVVVSVNELEGFTQATTRKLSGLKRWSILEPWSTLRTGYER